MAEIALDITIKDQDLRGKTARQRLGEALAHHGVPLDARGEPLSGEVTGYHDHATHSTIYHYRGQGDG